MKLPRRNFLHLAAGAAAAPSPARHSRRARTRCCENENPQRIQRDRLRIDTRKWMAARLAPKKYGDHISHDVKGGTNINFQPQILIQCSSAGEDDGFIDVRATSEAAGGLPQQGNGNLVRRR